VSTLDLSRKRPFEVDGKNFSSKDYCLKHHVKPIFCEMIIVYFSICYLVNFVLCVFAGGDAEIAAKRQATEGKLSFLLLLALTESEIEPSIR